MITKAVFNKAPLLPNPFAKLPAGAVIPKGELLERLQAQANGLAGHITEVWPSLRDTAWLGGDGDAWERAPYCFDGLIPLAHILGDKKLLALCDRFVEGVLASQRENGDFGPMQTKGWWPKMIALKCLKQAFESNADKRILPFMLRFFKYEYEALEQQPLELWATARAGENILTALWLYNISGDKGLLRLCDKLLQGSIDWTGHFSAFPDNTDLKRTNPWSELKRHLQPDEDPWSKGWLNHQLTHGVNLAMGLKTPMLDYILHGGLKQEAAFFAGYEKLMRAHGVANGMFTCDEHLSGSSPTQGSETCAVAEMLFTLETLMGCCDDARLGDLYERIGFNAMPAALSKDGWAHQYVQQVNQIRISKAPRPWYNNGEDANVFGLEPNFGCCTANLHQGLAKFAAHLWMATADGGLVCQSLAPCTVRFRAGGQKIRIEVDGEYPVKGDITITLALKQPASFPLKLRIPAWAKGCVVAVGEETFQRPQNGYIVLDRPWTNGDTIRVKLPMEPRTEKWYHQSAALYKGPLLYALPIEPKWSYAGEMPLCDRYAEAASPWNYALYLNDGIRVLQNGDMEVSAASVQSWTMAGENAAPPPVLPDPDGEPVTLHLIPYADAPLRIAQFPVGLKAKAETEKSL